MRVWGLLCGLFLVACYRSPSPQTACAITCDQTCPDGLTCEGGFCVEPGQVCHPSFTEVGAGAGFACGIDADRALWCWGSNTHHQISATDRLQFPLAKRISTKGWDVVDAGGEHVCAIADGELFCWGRNDHGQVSSTVLGDAAEPQQITAAGVDRWEQVSAGLVSTCAVGGGQLYCWGQNDQGQLGLGVLGADNGIPTKVDSLLTDWTTVSVGHSHACAISTSEGLHCWGYNDDGELGGNAPTVDLPYPSPLVVPHLGAPLRARAVTAVGTATCAALEADGALYCWGTNASKQLGDPAVVGVITASTAPVLATSVTGFTELAGTETYACGLAGDAVYCWGTAQSGGLGLGVWSEAGFGKVRTGVTQLAVGWVDEMNDLTMMPTRALDTSCAVVGGGDIQCWGDNRFGLIARGAPGMELTPTEVGGDHRFSALAIGAEHACGIEGESLLCWGSTVRAQTTGIVTGSTTPRAPCVSELDCDVGAPKEILFAAKATQIAVGVQHSCALHDQILTCWGDNVSYQLGGGAGPPRRDVAGPGGRPWQTLIATGGLAQCATPAPDETWCWGVPFTTPMPAKQRVTILDFATSLSPGNYARCFLDRDKHLACAGQNNSDYGNGMASAATCNPVNGVCDAGETAGSCPADCCPGGICAPELVATMQRTYDKVSTGPLGRSSCGLLPNGQVECWGVNTNGQTGSPAGPATYTPYLLAELTSCTEISMAGDHACAICGGAIRCWGDNRYGGLGIGKIDAPPLTAPQELALRLDDDPWVQLGSGYTSTCVRSESGRVFCWGAGLHAPLGNGGASAALPTTILASPEQ